MRRRCCRASAMADFLLWMAAFRRAVAQAEHEFSSQVGPDVATVVSLGLEAYARS